MMTADQKRQIQERLMAAKNDLLEALRVAESAATPFSTAIGKQCGQIEALQAKFADTKTKD